MQTCFNCSKGATKKLIVEPYFGEIYVCDNFACKDKVHKDIDRFSNNIKNNKKMKRFYRKDGILGGVCSGLAEYIGIDVLFVRLGFFFIPGAAGAYFLLWIFGPHENNINK